VFALKMR